MTSDQLVADRAGFWRRSSAYLIDSITISVLFQLIVAFLFIATSGHVQSESPMPEIGTSGSFQMGSFGVTYTSCSTLKTVPDGLVPPPPGGSNLAHECNVYTFFGAQTARILEAGRVTVEGAATKTASRTYMLDRDGHPIDGVSVGWISMLALFAYVVAMETRTGATLGSRAMRICVIDAAALAGPSVPLRKIVLRYLAMLIGFLPIPAVLLIFLLILWKHGSDIDEIAAINFLNWFLIAGFVLFGWTIFLGVQIAFKRDPLYDRIAGTAVLRV